ncbi:MAG: hypothetical protein R3C01_04245 [Planctomycetaceae bacterium]
MNKLEWYEPARFKRALSYSQGERVNIRFAVMFTVGVAAVIIAATHWHQKPVGGSWLLTYLVSLSPGLVLFGVIPLIERCSTNRIVLSDKGLTRSIVRGGGLQLYHWPWDDIAKGEVGSVILDEIEFPALLIETTAGEIIPVAITQLTDRNQLRQLFASHETPLAETDR